MKLASLPGAPHLTYCTNIHAGESWPEIDESLRSHLPRIRSSLDFAGPLGVGLRLSGPAASELDNPAKREAFQADLAAMDAATLPLVPILQRALQPGDDAALRAIIAVFEEAGLTVRAAHDIAPGLLPPTETLSQAPADDAVRADIAAAREALAEMARIDEGQACVIRDGLVLAREDARGTGAMLTDLAAPGSRPMPPADDPFNWLMDSVGDVLDDAADWLSGEEAERARLKGARGLLYKAPKPGQDRRADLPTIGPGTVHGAARAGLRGIALEAGGVIVLERAEVIRLCDRAGLFLTVREMP